MEMRSQVVRGRWDRGVALMMVLLFTLLVFLLVVGMLVTATHEITIAGFHRDGVRAEEHGVAGLEDLVRRIEAGRPWRPGAVNPADVCLRDDGSPGVRTRLPDSNICVAVVMRTAGPSGAVVEVSAEAAVGRVRRRLSMVVLARTTLALPNALVVHSLADAGDTQVASGEVYAQTLVNYRSAVSAERTTYAGWRIARVGADDAVGPCYTHDECVAAGRPQWWPGHRRAVYATQVFRPRPQPGSPIPDPRTPATVLSYTCPAGPSPDLAAHTVGGHGPGYEPGDLRADLNPADPRQEGLAGERLYGCTADGLPYTWVREAVDGRFLWFPVVPFDGWFARYWCFQEAHDALVWQPCNGFHPDPALGDPSLGAIPPPPSFDVWAQNYDRARAGGGTITLPADAGLGVCADPPQCRSPRNQPSVVLLDGGPYRLFCLASCPAGHGVLLVDGDLEIQGNFTYYGTVVVRGRMTVGAGAVTVYGHLVAEGLATLDGTLRILAGTAVAHGPAGPLEVMRRAWWER